MQSKPLNEQSEDPKEPSNVSSDDLNLLPQPQLSGHAWRQQGTTLVCESCPFNHASFIPVDYQLYGINDKGEPMIRKVSVSTSQVGTEPKRRPS